MVWLCRCRHPMARPTRADAPPTPAHGTRPLHSLSSRCSLEAILARKKNKRGCFRSDFRVYSLTRGPFKIHQAVALERQGALPCTQGQPDRACADEDPGARRFDGHQGPGKVRGGPSGGSTHFIWWCLHPCQISVTCSILRLMDDDGDKKISKVGPGFP